MMRALWRWLSCRTDEDQHRLGAERIALDRRALLGGLIASALASRAEGQGVVSGAGGRDRGIVRSGNSISFRTPDNSRPAATLLGVVFPPEPEPTGADNSGALWVAVSGTTGVVDVVLKVNILGTVVELASGTWELS